MLLFLIFFIFSHLDDHQIEFYDEARRGVSAIEMASGQHNFLVPHYNGEPDHWGTKPPLLVWLQSIFIMVFGVGELAVRLPSALASLGLLGLLTWWSKKIWGSIGPGVLGGMIMWSYGAYTQIHGGRSGDFEALLVLFLFGQLVFLYSWVTWQQRKYLFLAGLALFLAGMTKGIAGTFFLPGLGIWLLLDREGRKKLKNPALYGVMGTALVLVVGYYILREQYDPGYLQLVWENELGGRYGVAKENHAHPFLFFFTLLFQDRHFGFFFTLIPAATLVWYREEDSRRPGVLLLSVLLSFMLVISISATKLQWYAVPALPLIGMLSGGLLVRVIDSFGNSFASKKWRSIGKALLVSGIFLLPVLNTADRVMRPKHYQVTPKKQLYREGIRAFRDIPIYTVLALEYNPNARFYVSQAQAKGQDVRLAHALAKTTPKSLIPLKEPDFQAEDLVLVCRSETLDYLEEHYLFEDFRNVEHCKLVKILSDKGKRPGNPILPSPK